MLTRIRGWAALAAVLVVGVGLIALPLVGALLVVAWLAPAALSAPSAGNLVAVGVIAGPVGLLGYVGLRRTARSVLRVPALRRAPCLVDVGLRVLADWVGMLLALALVPGVVVGSGAVPLMIAAINGALVALAGHRWHYGGLLSAPRPTAPMSGTNAVSGPQR